MYTKLLILNSSKSKFENSWCHHAIDQSLDLLLQWSHKREKYWCDRQPNVHKLCFEIKHIFGIELALTKSKVTLFIEVLKYNFCKNLYGVVHSSIYPYSLQMQTW